jgi:hypothetical protein
MWLALAAAARARCLRKAASLARDCIPQYQCVPGGSEQSCSPGLLGDGWFSLLCSCVCIPGAQTPGISACTTSLPDRVIGRGPRCSSDPAYESEERVGEANYVRL